MSFALVKPYFTARCKAVGLKEHTDGFNQENIASSYIDKSFHVLLTGFTGRRPVSMQDQEIDCEVSVSFWHKGFRNPAVGIDAAVQKSEELIKEVLKSDNRLGQCLKNVVFNSVNYEPMSDSNDNAIKTTLVFTAFTSIVIE